MIFRDRLGGGGRSTIGSELLTVDDRLGRTFCSVDRGVLDSAELVLEREALETASCIAGGGSANALSRVDLHRSCASNSVEEAGVGGKFG